MIGSNLTNTLKENIFNSMLGAVFSSSNHDVSQKKVVDLDKAKIEKYVNISRWYNHVKHVM